MSKDTFRILVICILFVIYVTQVATCAVIAG